MAKVFTTKVIAEGDQLGLLIPEELFKELNLHENEILSWEIADDERSVTLRKLNFIDNTEK